MHHDPTFWHFSLASVPEQDRAETAREIFGRGIVNMDFTPLTDEPQLEVSVRVLPGVAITRGWNSPHIADSGYDQSRENDDIALVWGTTPGRGRLRQCGREIVGDDGTAALISCGDRVTAETRSAFHHVTVRLQRSRLLTLVPHTEAVLMQPVSDRNPALRLLTAYLNLLESGLDLHTPELAHAAATHICDLVAVALGARGEAGQLADRRGVRAARLAAIKRWIFDHLDSAALNVAAAAAAGNVSPRYVQRLFEDEGTTFSAFVLARRLALAHRRLCDPGLSHLAIGNIAYSSGVGDLSYFTRSFRAAYGETPGDVRQRAMARSN